MKTRALNAANTMKQNPIRKVLSTKFDLKGSRQGKTMVKTINRSQRFLKNCMIWFVRGKCYQ